MYSHPGQRVVALPTACSARPVCALPGFCPLGCGLLACHGSEFHHSARLFPSAGGGGHHHPQLPAPAGPWEPGTHGTCRRAPGGGRSRGAARASELVGPPPRRGGCWRPSHPCPTPSQRQRILATSKYPGSSWVDFPATCNTTRNGCRRDPRHGRPPRPRVKLRHSTGTARPAGATVRCLHQTTLRHFTCISTCAELDVHFSESFPEWSCECQKKTFSSPI